MSGQGQCLAWHLIDGQGKFFSDFGMMMLYQADLSPLDAPGNRQKG